MRELRRRPGPESPEEAQEPEQPEDGQDVEDCKECDEETMAIKFVHIIIQGYCASCCSLFMRWKWTVQPGCPPPAQNWVTGTTVLTVWQVTTVLSLLVPLLFCFAKCASSDQEIFVASGGCLGLVLVGFCLYGWLLEHAGYLFELEKTMRSLLGNSKLPIWAWWSPALAVVLHTYTNLILALFCVTA